MRSGPEPFALNAKNPAPRRKPGPASPEKGRSPRAAAVLTAAREVFFEHGFAAATTDMIQRAAGVSKSTLYVHFPNKEGIFAAVIDAECAAYIAEIRALRTPDAPLYERLVAVALAYLDIVLSPDGLALYRIVIAEAPRAPDLAHAFYRAGPGEMNVYLQELLMAASAKGEIAIAPASLGEAAALLANMIRGEAHMRALTEPAAPPSADLRRAWAALAVTAFLRAYGDMRTGSGSAASL